MQSKLYLLLIVLLLFIKNSQAQEKLFIQSGILTADEKNIITQGTKLKIDRNVLAKLYANKPDELSIAIPIVNEVVIVNLKRRDLFAKNFDVIVSGNLETVPYTPGYYLHGIIENEEHSFAAISIFDDFVGGIISYRGNNYNLVIANNRNDHSDDNYIIYADKDYKADHPKCFTKDIDQPVSLDKNLSANNLSPYLGCPVDIYYETGYSMFQNLGSVQNVMNYLTILFNGVQDLYDNESIRVQIRQVRVWNTADPEIGYSNMIIALGSFAGRMDFSGFNGDLAQLVSFTVYGGGAAWLDNLCTNNYGKSSVCGDLAPNYSPYPNYSFSVSVMAHETGHTIGSPHTHSCTWPGGPIDNCVPVDNGPCAPGPTPINGGTIMSYCHLATAGINFANGFGPLPGNLLRTKIADAASVGCTCNCNNLEVDITKLDKNCNHPGTATAVITGGTGPFSYSWSNGGTGPSITNLAGGIYYVTVTGGTANCKVIKGVKILDSSIRVVLSPVAGVVTRCTNQTYSISATVTPAYSAYTYQWYKNNILIPGATSANISFTSSITATVLYYVIATGGGCVIQSALTTVNFVDIPTPVITVNGSTSICDGQSVVLSMPTTPYYIEWQQNGVLITGATNPSNSVNAAGSYTVRNYFPLTNGCSVTSAPVNITVLPLPDASVNTTSLAICSGQYGTITHPATTGDTYTWYHNNVLIPGATNNFLNVNTGGNYYIRVTGANGCINTGAITVVTIHPLPDVTIDPADNYALCDGGSFSLHAVALNQAQYSWYNGTQPLDVSNDNILNVTAAGNYSVIITNTITGCTNTSSQTVVTTYPPPAIRAINDTIIAIGQPYQLMVHGLTAVPVDRYVWEPATGLNDPFISNPVTTLTHDQEYTVKGFYPSGCFAVDKVFIRVIKGPAIYVPSAFSPNDDARNDLLKCTAVWLREIKYFDIYNRYGQKIFHSNDVSRGWNGTWKGIKMQVGTYVYIAEGIDYRGKPVISKGTVTIIY